MLEQPAKPFLADHLAAVGRRTVSRGRRPARRCVAQRRMRFKLRRFISPLRGARGVGRRICHQRVARKASMSVSPGLEELPEACAAIPQRLVKAEQQK